jgi:hypothetical protein
MIYLFLAETNYCCVVRKGVVSLTSTILPDQISHANCHALSINCIVVAIAMTSQHIWIVDNNGKVCIIYMNMYMFIVICCD